MNLSSAKHIVIVDDHQLFIDGISLVITTRFPGVEITSFNSSGALLETLDSESGFDLILLDISLPEIGGPELLEALRNREILIPTIMISATENLGEINRVLESGAMGFIPKSYPSESMIEAIDMVLTGQIFVPEELQPRLARQKASGNGPDNRAYRDFGITDRQYQVLQYLEKGFSNRQIATALYLSENTIKTHVTSLFEALQADSRGACVRAAKDRDIL